MFEMKRLVMVLLLAGAALFGAACGGADIGEACEQGGKTDECVDGAVCAQAVASDTVLHCLKICEDVSDCASTEDCNGVTSTNLKACRPK